MTEKKVENVFNPRKEFFDSTFIYLIMLVLFVGIRIFANFNPLAFMGEFADLAYSLIIQVGVMFLLPLFLYKKFQNKTIKQIFKDFRFNKISLKAVLICVGLGFLLIFLNVAFNSIYSFILSIFGYSSSSGAGAASYPLYLFLITIFASAILPGFCEEFANRGLLLNGLKGLGMKKAIIISGLLFGLMHLNIGQFGYATLVGMFFAYICIATGSIIPGMIIHFLNNAITEYLSFASINDLFLGNFYNMVGSLSIGSGFFGSILLIFMILLTVAFLFIWLTYLLIKTVRKERIQQIGDELAESIEKVPEDMRPKSMKIKIPLSIFGINPTQSYFPSLKTKIPLILAIFLGSVVTIMTLIWGTL